MASSPLLPVNEAVQRILAGVRPTGPEMVPLAEAAGRVPVAPLSARRTQPPFDASSMDGYAVRAADAVAGAKLKVVGESQAGRRFPGTVAPGEAIRIFTGAPVPPGADAVLIQENSEPAGEGVIRVTDTVTQGRNIRGAGIDFLAGEPLVPVKQLDFRDLSLLAAMDHPQVEVRRRPRVALIATGDELVLPGAPAGPDQIMASSGVAVAALVASYGGEPLDLGIVPDREDQIVAAIGQAIDANADVLVTLGGASVGDRDLVRAGLLKRGMALDFWRIAMRPGKPLIFGRLGDMRVLGLPGNPVSTLVCSLLFLRPLLDALLGLAPSDPTEPAVLGADVRENDAREDYMRATIERGPDGLAYVTPLKRQDSSLLSDFAAADCLLVRPARAPAAFRGEPCRIVPLR